MRRRRPPADHGDVRPQGHHIPPAVIEADQEAAAQVGESACWHRGSRQARRPRVRGRGGRVRRVPTAGWRRRCGRGHGPATAAARRPAARGRGQLLRSGPSPRSWTLPRDVSSRPPSPRRAAASPNARACARDSRPPGTRTLARKPSAASWSRTAPGQASPRPRTPCPVCPPEGIDMAGSIPAVPGSSGWPTPLCALLCCARSPIRTPAAESGKPEEAGVTPARSRHCDRGPPAAGARNSCRSHPARGEDPEEEGLRCCSCCRPLTPT